MILPVGVAQGDAEVPGDGLQRVDGNVDQRCDEHIDVDGRPAHDEDSHHHQDHAGDPTQVPVLFLFAEKFIYISEEREAGGQATD